MAFGAFAKLCDHHYSLIRGRFRHSGKKPAAPPPPSVVTCFSPLPQTPATPNLTPAPVESLILDVSHRRNRSLWPAASGLFRLAPSSRSSSPRSVCQHVFIFHGRLHGTDGNSASLAHSRAPGVRRLFLLLRVLLIFGFDSSVTMCLGVDLSQFNLLRAK